MPNRLIKESIWTSPNLNLLSAQGERHFWRILPSVDDFGCYEATPAVIKGKCYPLKDDVSLKDIKLWQDELTESNIIISWHSGRGDYAVVITFPKHNYLRSLHKRKTPTPPAWVVIQLLAELPEWKQVLGSPPSKSNTQWEAMSEEEKSIAIAAFGPQEKWDNYNWIAATGKLPDEEWEFIKSKIEEERAHKEETCPSCHTKVNVSVPNVTCPSCQTVLNFSEPKE